MVLKSPRVLQQAGVTLVAGCHRRFDDVVMGANFSRVGTGEVAQALALALALKGTTRS